MKRSGQRKQDMTQIIKKYPQDHAPAEELHKSHQPGKAKGPDLWRRKKLIQTGGAQYSILVFGKTFPAEKTAAFRAAGHGLAKFVIKAALAAEILHYNLPKSFVIL